MQRVREATPMPPTKTRRGARVRHRPRWMVPTEPAQRLRPPTGISYVAKRTPFGLAVFVERANFGRPLHLRRPELVCGSGWSHSEEASRDLATAILLDAGCGEALAERLGASFSSEVIASLPVVGFRLTRDRVVEWIDARNQPDLPAGGAPSAQITD
jgi:hypothetical protein